MSKDELLGYAKGLEAGIKLCQRHESLNKNDSGKAEAISRVRKGLHKMLVDWNAGAARLNEQRDAK